MEEADLLAASLREYGSMDLHTYHTLMMGNTKLGRHQRVLVLYFEALDSSARLDGGIYSLAMLGALNCQLFQQVRPPPPLLYVSHLYFFSCHPRLPTHLSAGAAHR
jgi:hypothetical protein